MDVQMVHGLTNGFLTWPKLQTLSKSLQKQPESAHPSSYVIGPAYWQHTLTSLVNFFLAGIAQGFRIGYHNPQSSLKSAKRNLACALQHPEVIDRYLDEELALQ